jgi:hypothetical protein
MTKETQMPNDEADGDGQDEIGAGWTRIWGKEVLTAGVNGLEAVS